MATMWASFVCEYIITRSPVAAVPLMKSPKMTAPFEYVLLASQMTILISWISCVPECNKSRVSKRNIMFGFFFLELEFTIQGYPFFFFGGGGYSKAGVDSPFKMIVSTYSYFECISSLSYNNYHVYMFIHTHIRYLVRRLFLSTLKNWDGLGTRQPYLPFPFYVKVGCTADVKLIELLFEQLIAVTAV